MRLFSLKTSGNKIEYKNYSGVIIETEAYMDDEASHAHTITPRSEIMQRTHGHIYVYVIYGMYHCLNITTNKDSRGAVLIRALAPLTGIEQMKQNRKTTNLKNLTSGLGKLFQALEITKDLNGSLLNTELFISTDTKIPQEQIRRSPRIGITNVTKLQWRFFVKNNTFVSK